MRKAVSVLALIALACDFSRDALVCGDPARKPETAGRSDGYEHHQKDLRGQFDKTEAPRRSADDREVGLSEPVGKWRSNGEAVEPKWRDGDSVPLLPFSQYRSYSRDDGLDGEADQDDLPTTTRRSLKHRYTVNRPRGGSSRRLPVEYGYEPTYRARDYDDPDEDYPRKRRRPLKNPQHDSVLYEETIEVAPSNDGKRGRNVLGDLSNDEKDATSARYREAFQARPSEYEHEFNDEEYLRPRPRKRRPPQNYEFALVNEASASGTDERSAVGTSRPLSQSKATEEYQPVTQSPNKEGRRTENAFELKSLLKMQQEEGSSLSEILQRRNLTLSDLLKGKTDVINALKSRIADESDEYIEEMSRVMSDSLMKLSVTVSPPWKSTQTTSITSAATTTKSVTSSTPNDQMSRVTAAAAEITSKSHDETSPSDDGNRAKEELEEAEIMTLRQSAHDSSWPRATTPASISITTSTLPPVVNSMEYFLNDDGNAGSTSDRGAKLENLDEDEIMEFSDFTDFKKAKSPATGTSSAWSSLSSERTTSHNVGSTLSIEQILNPTERIQLTKDCGDQADAEDNHEEEASWVNGQPVSTSESSADEYDAFVETEYQNDAAIEFDNDDRRRENTSVDSNLGEVAASLVEKKQITSSAGDKNDMHNRSQSTTQRPTNQLNGEESYDALKNHRGVNNKRYEEVVSEIEPEARAEIFELFASGSAGKRLERLLKSRNMSVEELIALRQRGSSKVHLSEVSRLRESTPKDPKTSKNIVTNAEISMPAGGTDERSNEDMKRIDMRQDMQERSMSEIKQDIVSYLHDSFFGEGAENVSMSKLLNLVERDRNALMKATTSDSNETQNDDEYSKSGNSHQTVQIVDLLTTFGSIPFAKEVQRQLDLEVANDRRGLEMKFSVNKNKVNESIVLIKEQEKTVRSNDSASEFHAGYVEEIVREKPNAIDIKTIYGDETASDETANDMNDGENKRTLSKIKPSIIASGAILGVTIIVFLAIFVVCRIRQKQKYTYRNTFSRAVFQGPALAARKLSNSSSLSAVMVNVIATSTSKRPEKMDAQEEFDRSDIDNDSLDANDSWETIPDYAK